MIAAHEAERAAQEPMCAFLRYRTDQKPWCWARLFSPDLPVAAGDELSSVLFCVSGDLKLVLLQVEYCSKEMPLPSMACRGQKNSNTDTVNEHVYTLVHGLEDE